MSSFLDQYEPLDIIGNGSFGIIRKVRRKADGTVFARKELNFERMTERDRKQIVAEVNILKDLHHEHIVRYHDRYVDRDAGILYILMEYCGGGDLSGVIKQAVKTNRPIPEDTIWNYFMQILLALHHCHHPNGHGRSGSGSSLGFFTSDENVKDRRAQILHRDLKPDNVFLDENNTVKLGDFGLSKALAQSNFANTYVGTPYYMSPELMQEKAYDSKSDIWSLGCLIYELCALKPPFHEAKTHTELSICIRNGRIPPLPRGYSQSLSAVIKAMLNLNPAMRPSAAQLLQHERLELSFRVSETDKLLSQVKHHRATVLAKEREVVAREETLKDKERRLSSILSEKDGEITGLQTLVSHLQQQLQTAQRDVETATKQAVARREDELRVLIARREEEVASAMARREEEIMEAVRRREAEVCQAWAVREAEIRKEVETSIKAVQERVEWIMAREEELQLEAERIEELQEKMKIWETSQKGKVQKTPLEEIKNVSEPVNRGAQETPVQRRRQQHKNDQITPKVENPFPTLQTPIMRPNYAATLPSAMKGVVLTSTGEILATPTPAELTNLFNQSPKVGLNFTKIFECGSERRQEEKELNTSTSEDFVESPPPSPTARKEKEWKERERGDSSDTGSSTSSTASSKTAQAPGSAVPPTRIRKPSIRASAQRPQVKRAASCTGPAPSASTRTCSSSSSANSAATKPSPQPNQQSVRAKAVPVPVPVPKNKPAPEYDPADEENLPSPFLKKIEKERIYGKVAGTSSSSSSSAVSPAFASASVVVGPVGAGGSLKVAKKRPSTSNGNYLRAVAAANNAGKRAASTTTTPMVGEEENVNGEALARPSLQNARKAGEEARKALSRS